MVEWETSYVLTCGVPSSTLVSNCWTSGNFSRLYDFHDRCLSRGQKLSRRAAEERGVNSFCFFAACVGLSAVVPISDRTRLPFAVSDQRVVLNRRLSL